MTAPAVAEVLDGARIAAGLSGLQLWIGCCAIGGSVGPALLHRYLAGTATPTRGDYDVIAQAINDRFIDIGSTQVVPYADDLPR